MARDEGKENHRNNLKRGSQHLVDSTSSGAKIQSSKSPRSSSSVLDEIADPFPDNSGISSMEIDRILVISPQKRRKTQQQEQQQQQQQQQQPGKSTAVVTSLISGVNGDENNDQTAHTTQQQQQQQDGVTPANADSDEVFFSGETAMSMQIPDIHNDTGRDSGARPHNNDALQLTLLHQASCSSHGLVS